MIETAKAAADTASWLIVDPDTYRYFFSASAQVFAAIFAVVAIAYNFRLIEIGHRQEDLRKEKVRKILTHIEIRELLEIGIPVQEINGGGPYGGRSNYLFHEAVQALDDSALNDLLDRIECKAAKDPMKNAIANSISITIAKEQGVRGEKREANRYVSISIVLAAIMTVISLGILWLEWYKSGGLVLAALCLFCLAILFIAYLFIKSFSSKPKSAQSVSSV